MPTFTVSFAQPTPLLTASAAIEPKAHPIRCITHSLSAKAFENHTARNFVVNKEIYADNFVLRSKPASRMMADRQRDVVVVSLRERQKVDRRARIIAAARQIFSEAGIENITIEAIADIAGVSSVTVHNYYGTKSGVLLALVAESDRELLESMEKSFAGRSMTLIDLVLNFASIILDHTLTHLDKAIWRQVIAATVADSDPRFGKLYRDLDNRLAQALTHELERLARMGQVAGGISVPDLGRALFNLQNTRFIEFVATDETSKAAILQRLNDDLTALFGALPERNR